jgi:hypothetical protein
MKEPVKLSTTKLKRSLQVIAEPECVNCGGFGLRVKNNYEAACRRLEVMIDVCPCVRIAPVER